MVGDSIRRRSVRPEWIRGVAVLPARLPAPGDVHVDGDRERRLARQGHVPDDGPRSTAKRILYLRLSAGQSASVTLSLLPTRVDGVTVFTAVCLSVYSSVSRIKQIFRGEFS